jgi:hypothetical protein
METEGQRSSSEPLTSPIGSPIWNEILTFEITTGRDQINIVIQDSQGRYLCSGLTYIDGFKDQAKHEEWIELRDESGRNNIQGAGLIVTFHWIHSRKKFLQDILQVQEQSIVEQ